MHSWYTASCCMLSRWPRLLPGIPYAALSVLCCICSQMREAALHFLWIWTPGEVQTICTALAHSWCSTGTKGSDPAPPRSARAAFAFGSFFISQTIRKALNCRCNLLQGVPCACLALLSHIYSQMKKAALQLLWSFLPGWIQTTCTCLAHFWYSTGKEDPAAAPPRRASFAFGSFVISKIIRIALSRCTALLLDGSCACLALLCHICSQLQKAALHLLWSWAPGWIQTTFTILTFLWHNTGKKGSAAAPPETASFGFGDYIVVIVRRVRTCPTEVPPPPSGTPGGATSDEDKSGMPDTQHAGGGGNQDATQVGFSLVILCWYWPAGVCLAALMLLSCLPACS